MPAASPLLVASFVALALALAILFVVAVYVSAVHGGLPIGRARGSAARAALFTALWMGATLAAAASGRLSFESMPPTMLPVVAGTFALAFGIGVSRLGARLAAGLPLAALVGFQAFRLPLELMLHRAYVEGLMPVQMSYSGLNFDIVSGVTAALVAALLLAGRAPRWLVGAWNGLGALLLAVIVTIAILSAPVQFRLFHNEPANVWITRAPWVWLPAVMVLSALLGHLLLFRRLRAEAKDIAPSRAGAVSVA
jgi:hypothetical protein